MNRNVFILEEFKIIITNLWVIIWVLIKKDLVLNKPTSL